MVLTTSLYNSIDIYSKSFNKLFTNDIMNYNKKLFATFVTKDEIENVVGQIREKLSGKCDSVFVLEIVDSDEYLLTYNVDNCTQDELPEKTIMVHRQKTTIYTINGLNELIKKLNGGVVDEKYPINWKHYEYSFLTNYQNEFKQLKTIKRDTIKL